MFIFILVAVTGATNCHSKRPYNPLNYMSQLPSLSLPYVDLPIKPSPVVPTKVISVVTEYLYVSPVCVKVSGKKPLCGGLEREDPKKPSFSKDSIVTKELLVKDRQRKSMVLQGSETPRPFSKLGREKTPFFTPEAKELLIEDRLDHLEAILPHYTRRRVYETSTLTVTKVENNNRATATLLVKNCVPQGYRLCPGKKKARQKALLKNSTKETKG